MFNEEYQRLLNNVRQRPITLVRFDSNKSDGLQNSANAFNHFTFVLSHDCFSATRKNSICIFELNSSEKENHNCYYLGVVNQKSTVSTLDTRVSVKKLTRINLSSFEEIIKQFKNERLKTTFNERLILNCEAVTLTSATSEASIIALLNDVSNHVALKTAMQNLKLSIISKSHMELLQEDAENMALKIFGLDLNKKHMYEDRIYEDNVIQYDLHNLEGFTRVAGDYTGKVTYVKNQEKLTIYHANKLPLEEMLGVDLIYINETMNSIVMIQYKMLEREYDNWLFRPDDQMEKEIVRMKIPKSSGICKGYRINNNPFFFKFVKREANSLGASFVISLEHYHHYISTEKAVGPRGGVRIGFDTLNRHYLTPSDIINLIRSGYIGTHIEETEAMRIIIDEVARGHKNIIIAWQNKVIDGVQN